MKKSANTRSTLAFCLYQNVILNSFDSQIEWNLYLCSCVFRWVENKNFPFQLLKTFKCPPFPAHHFCFNHSFPPAGPFNVPVLQLQGEGRGADKVLPRFLLRVRQDALRHASEEVPQVQRRFRSQRLPPHLHRLMLHKHVRLRSATWCLRPECFISRQTSLFPILLQAYAYAHAPTPLSRNKNSSQFSNLWTIVCIVIMSVIAVWFFLFLFFLHF